MGSGAVTTLALPFLGEAGPVTVWVVVLVFVFLECAFIIGLFLPGDSLLIAAGVLLAEHGHESGAWLLGGVATAVAVAGNQVGYLVGRYTGTRMLARKEGRVLNRANLARATAFFERWGFWAIVVARWIPWIRTLAPMIAGAARMDNRRYITANAVGAACWVPTLILLGFYGAGLLDAAAVAPDHRGGAGGGGLRARQRRGSLPVPAGDAPPDRRGRPAPRRCFPPGRTARRSAPGRPPRRPLSSAVSQPARCTAAAASSSIHAESCTDRSASAHPGRGERAGRRQSWANTGPPPSSSRPSQTAAALASTIRAAQRGRAPGAGPRRRPGSGPGSR